MNRESAYALSLLVLLLSSLFYFNLVSTPFDRRFLSRFDFWSHITPNYDDLQIQPPPTTEACDYSKGQWVWDEAQSRRDQLLYDEQCPFLDPGFRCLRNGRRDEGYRQWRWQPHDCDLPRYVCDHFVACMHGFCVRVCCVFLNCFDVGFCNFEIRLNLILQQPWRFMWISTVFWAFSSFYVLLENGFNWKESNNGKERGEWDLVYRNACGPRY